MKNWQNLWSLIGIVYVIVVPALIVIFLNTTFQIMISIWAYAAILLWLEKKLSLLSSGAKKEPFRDSANNP